MMDATRAGAGAANIVPRMRSLVMGLLRHLRWALSVVDNRFGFALSVSNVGI